MNKLFNQILEEVRAVVDLSSMGDKLEYIKEGEYYIEYSNGQLNITPFNSKENMFTYMTVNAKSLEDIKEFIFMVLTFEYIKEQEYNFNTIDKDEELSNYDAGKFTAKSRFSNGAINREFHKNEESVLVISQLYNTGNTIPKQFIEEVINLF